MDYSVGQSFDIGYYPTVTRQDLEKYRWTEEQIQSRLAKNNASLGTVEITGIQDLDQGFKVVTFKEGGESYGGQYYTRQKLMTPGGQFLDGTARAVGSDIMKAPSFEGNYDRTYKQALFNLTDTNQPQLIEEYKKMYGVGGLSGPNNVPGIAPGPVNPLATSSDKPNPLVTQQANQNSNVPPSPTVTMSGAKDPVDIASSYVYGKEFLDSKANDAAVNQLYKSYFGRNATAAELANWGAKGGADTTVRALENFLQSERVKYGVKTPVAPIGGTVTPAATPSAPTSTSTIPFRSGLTDAQKSSLINLANKPISQWSQLDKDNWRYGTNGAPLPGTSSSGDPAQMRNEAAEKANEAAQKIFDDLENKSISTRESSKILSEIKEKIAEPLPKPPSLVEQFQRESERLGVPALQAKLDDLDTQIRELDTSLLVESQKAGRRVQSTREIARRRSTLQQETDERKAFLNLERDAVARQLNGKISTLNTIMTLTGQDYSNATNYYEATVNRNIQLYNLISGQEDREQTEQERAKNEARSNLTTIQNLLNDKGLTYNDLSPEQKTQVSLYELQAGLPQGLTATILKDAPGSKIQTVNERTTATGDTYFDVLTVGPDGSLNVKSVYRGKERVPSSGGGSGDDKDNEKFFADISATLDDLATGKRQWGEAFNFIKSKWGADDDIIDSLLNKSFWAQPGAFEMQQAGRKSTDGPTNPFAN